MINRWESQDSLEYDDSFKSRKASKELIWPLPTYEILFFEYSEQESLNFLLSFAVTNLSKMTRRIRILPDKN